ncbi:hypothetical protein CHO01_17100 [Cellulomonas hominis]|uniref:Uncharacterized protein n=1 Tax=Cellulomonas hominis TaxID=156981 RepID=A0A511FDB2_9CELL|nr:hypothetical protein [Cellulomonas hominis]MBB5474556.1 hypothetical protein [Cellulomonas hominis]NKY05606.1 hypothetical protein [Cellulomonas hominis]GEL46594.1 hypothetical protein CHO01_17100 [Cellulomonas hominis]
MSFNESQHPRATAGVSAGGQFVTKVAAEANVHLVGLDDLEFEDKAREATNAIIELLPGAGDCGDDAPAVLWPAEDGDDDKEITTGVNVLTGEKGQWSLERGPDRITSTPGLSMSAHPAAVAAWLSAARDADGEDLVNYASGVRNDGISRAVANELEGVAVWDEGGGTTIWFGSRTEPGAPGDHAFIVPAGEHEGRWQFQSDDFSDSPEGYRTEVVTSDLTVESDPKVVAAWVREQAEKLGSVPYTG